MQKKHRTKSKTLGNPKNAPILQIVTSAAFGTGIGLAVFAVVITVSCALSMLTKNPHALVFPLSLISIYISAFISGFVTLRRNGREKAMICGIASGICFTLILGILLVPFNSKDAVSVNMIYKLINIPVATVGAFCALRKKAKKRKKF